MKRFKKLLLTLGLACTASLSCVFAASCKDDKAKISYNTDGGEKISADYVAPGKTHELPIPQKTGYAFDGWYLTADFTGEPVTSIVVEGNVTYYAKWSKLEAITLELDGGSLSETTLYLKAGADLYAFMQDYTPTKAGLTFGAWFMDGAEITATSKMPVGGVTLTAKYKVEYKIERYLQNLGDDGYTKAEEDVVGSEYVGKEFTADVKETGFSVIKHANSVEKKTLTATAADNVFKVYYDRETYTVIFKSTETNESKPVTVKYGVEVEIPSDYTREGYCLIGWSESEGGEVLYEANYIKNSLFENNGKPVEKVTFLPERNIQLFAVWEKGYVDLFGANDYIFVVEEENKVYLARGEKLFEGSYDAKNNEFYFENAAADGKVILEGRLYKNGTFAYKQKASSAKLYEAGKGLVDTTMIYFDQYNGITYSVVDPATQQTSDSKGTFIVNEEGYYVATFTSGALAGEERIFFVSTMTSTTESGATVTEPAFRIRKEEDIALGQLRNVGITPDYQIGSNGTTLEFDGFSTATYTTSNGSATYNYSKDENGVITLSDSSDNVVGTIRIVDVGGQKGFCFYNENLNGTFTVGAGETLTLDGLYNVTYTKNNTTVTGYYTYASSVFGGVIVSFEKNAIGYKFMITATKVADPEGGEGATKLQFNVEKILYTYAEYYHKDENGIYYAPMLVIDEKEEGKATLYGFTADREFVKVSDGSYEYNDGTGLYVYSVENRYEAADAYTEPYDLSTIESFVYNLDESSYAVNYWYSSKDKENVETKYDVDYTGENGETLKLVGGFAFYETADETKVVGTYTKSGELLTIAETKSGRTTYYYLQIKDKDTPFEVLQYAPYKAYFVNENGKVEENKYIYFDGKGNASLTTLDGETETVEATGTFAYINEDTEFGDKIYKFTATGKEFKYLPFTQGNSQYYTLFNDGYELEYTASGILVLDGYGYKASYSVGKNTYEGNYYIEEKGSQATVVLVTEEDTFYFDLSGNGFTVKGQEYGQYVLIENGYLNDVYVELDGYGKLAAYTLELKAGSDTEYEKVYIDEDGEYEETDGVYTLKYTDGSATVAYACVMGGNVSGYGSLVIENDNDVVKIYINEEDWSVLILDAYGNAEKYDTKGQKQEGSYRIITENLLYFAYADGTDACLYKYDSEKGEATPIELTKKGYYTKDLRSLLFTEYGFVIVNGNTADPYYYNVENGQVIMYKHDATATDANDYGFVAIDDLGLLEDVETFENETYYRNSGYDITFDRAESKITEYPLVSVKDNAIEKVYLTGLDFTPSGAAEFSVKGDAMVKIVTTVEGSEPTEQTTTVDCTVTRTVAEDGTVEMYATINGYYRFYITLTYNGVQDDEEQNNNTMSVTGLRFVLPLYAYRYLDIYYRLYAMGGAGYANSYNNSIGFLTLNEEFDVDGVSTGTFVTGEFGEGSEMYDTKGEIVSFENATYTIDENEGVYIVQFTGADNYVYRLYFVVQRHSYLGAYGYYVSAFTREQTVTAGDYKVVTEKIIATERTDLTVGDFYKITLKDSEDQAIESARVFTAADGRIAYVTAGTEITEGQMKGCEQKTYYWISLENATSGSVEEDEKVIPLYKDTATVEAQTAMTVFSEDKKLYADVIEGDIVLIQTAKTVYYVSEIVSAEEMKMTVKTTDDTTIVIELLTAEDGSVYATFDIQ